MWCSTRSHEATSLGEAEKWSFVFLLFGTARLTSFFLDTISTMPWVNNHGRERKGKESRPADILLADNIIGPRGVLPPFTFPSAADLSAAKGRGGELQELQELAKWQERMVRYDVPGLCS